jgi:hypothetical protein
MPKACFDASPLGARSIYRLLGEGSQIAPERPAERRVHPVASEHEKEVELVIQRPLRGFDGRAELSRKRAKRTSQLPP